MDVMETGTEQTAKQRAIPADTWGHRLMLARAHAGHLSIREAAEKCGIGRGAWTNWERGARPVDQVEVAEIISERLGVDRDWLLFGGPLARPERGTRRGRLNAGSGPMINVSSSDHDVRPPSHDVRPSPGRPTPPTRAYRTPPIRTADPARPADRTDRTGVRRPRRLSTHAGGAKA